MFDGYDGQCIRGKGRNEADQDLVDEVEVAGRVLAIQVQRLVVKEHVIVA